MEIIDCPNHLIYSDGKVLNKIRNKFVKQDISVGGYPRIILTNNKIRKNITIHRLIALHYIPNPDNKPYVDHINRIKTDNRICNLRWCSHLENMQNKNKYKSNKSGHKNISFDKSKNKWVFRKEINHKIIKRDFKNKIDAICYKFIRLLIKRN
tara:strand:- start:55 stop:513 length:459 start_codon:yes stop_codon:yes gene_type:complete